MAPHPAASLAATERGHITSNKGSPAMLHHAQLLEPRRLLSAGGLDANFGTNGVISTDVGNGAYRLIDWGVTPSGKVVALGQLTPTTGDLVQTHYTLTRFNADG